MVTISDHSYKEDGLRNFRRIAPLVVALLLCGAVPASAGPRLLPTVAVGDSFISGYGGSPYQPGTDTPTNQCQRSTTSAPALVAKTRLIRLTDLSCAGATTADLLTSSRFGEQPQITRIPANTRLVYVMIGGNDMGFGRVLGCFVVTDCDFTTIPAETLDSITQLGPKLDMVNAAIRAKAPKARVVVQLYPALLLRNMSGPDNGCPWLNKTEEGLGQLIQIKLNDMIWQRAQNAGFEVAYPAIHTSRRSLCGTDPWFYPIGSPGEAHPTLEGRWAMAWEFAKHSL